MKTTQRPDNHEALAALCDTWLQRAKAKFQSARQEPDEKGRLQIEHGATCYFNCAQELLQLLQAGDMPADLQLEEVERGTISRPSTRGSQT